MPVKGKRRIRIELPEEQHFHAEGESWAVSYADFLMVLLSFFIIFFSYSQEKTKSIIEQIVIETQKGAGEGNAKGEGPGGDGEGPAFRGAKNSFTGFGPDKNGTFERKPAQALSAILSQGGFQIEQKEKQLVLHFPDEIFLPGGIDLPPEGRDLFFSVLKKLEPYKSDLKFTIIGHTDQSQIVRLKSKHLRNNFDLSVLRATRALNEALEWGLDPYQVSAKGVAYQMRNTRSLSLILEEKRNTASN